MMERLKQTRKRWFPPLILVLVGLLLMAPLGVSIFIKWFIQQPPLVSLAIIGILSLALGFWLAVGITTFDTEG